MAGLHYDEVSRKMCWYVLLVSMIISPLMIPIVLVQDTLAVVRSIIVCIGQLVRYFRLDLLLPGYAVVFRIQEFAVKSNILGLMSWLDLENYERMHNVVAAVCQSLPTLILNSVLYSLGNKPSHGEFLTEKLFLMTFVASSLAVLKSLLVVLWQAYNLEANPFWYATNVVAGTLVHHAQQASKTSNSMVASLAARYCTEGSAPLGSVYLRQGL